VYTRDAGVTPLWAAARAGSLECVRALLESGACARGTCSHLLDDEEGDDAEFAQPPAVLLYEEPLHAAARWGGEPQLGTAMVRALLEAGAHPDPPLAVRMYEDVFERRDARVSEAALLRWPGSSPKPAAARGAASPPLLPGPAAALSRSRAHSGGSSLTALVLVVSGQAANRRPLHSTGSASTMTASVAGTSEGAGSPETQGLWGSPADAGSVHACASQHVAAGTDGIIDEEPPTPLFLAVAANNTESVRLLLAAGASASRRVTVGVEHSQSLTPLHAAVLTGNALIVRMLLGAGADTTARVELEAGDGCVMPTAGAPVGIPSPGTVGSGSMGVPGSAASWPATVAIPPCNMGGAGSMSGTPDAGRECECGTPVRLEAGDLPNLAGASPLQLAYRFGRRAAQTILQGYPE
jgi:ankyrin repeat protein